MLNPMLAAAPLMLLLAGPAVAPQQPSRALGWSAVSAKVQHITVHVPRMTVTTTTIVTRSAPPAYREKKADDCVKMKKVIGFAVTTNDAIDLVLDDGTRLRARFGSTCQSGGFYSGFYVKPNPDGKMCAGRDVLRTRAGKSCPIGQFTKLVPAR